jgi:hypothetical protein
MTNAKSKIFVKRKVIKHTRKSKRYNVTRRRNIRRIQTQRGGTAKKYKTGVIARSLMRIGDFVNYKILGTKKFSMKKKNLAENLRNLPKASELESSHLNNLSEASKLESSHSSSRNSLLNLNLNYFTVETDDLSPNMTDLESFKKLLTEINMDIFENISINNMKNITDEMKNELYQKLFNDINTSKSEQGTKIDIYFFNEYMYTIKNNVINLMDYYFKALNTFDIRNFLSQYNSEKKLNLKNQIFAKIFKDNKDDINMLKNMDEIFKKLNDDLKSLNTSSNA